MLNKRVSRKLLSCLLLIFFITQSLPYASARPLSSLTRERKGSAELRAPRNFDVQHYIIRVSFNRDTKTVFGDVTVKIKPLTPALKTFNLNAKDLNVKKVTVESSNKELFFKTLRDKLDITLDRAYSVNETISVRIVYQAQPNRGLYFTKQGEKNSFVVPAQIWTQGEPEDNSAWFPCYDFPDDKATTEQFITTDSDELAIGNGVLIETTTNPDKTKTYHWSLDAPYATYLVSMVVGKYVKLEDKYKDTAIEYYVYPGSEEVSRKAFNQTLHMMELFENNFRFPFPYKRYAQTIVADFNIFAGMENMTSTTLADTYILNENAYMNEATEELISHELAHSWFGNLVTCKNWSHLWLNEGFATYMEAAYDEQTEGRAAYLQKIRSDAMTYLMPNPYGISHPLVNKYYNLQSELFDEVTYQKGSVVIHMLRQTVGDEIFWQALNLYLNEFKFKAAETSDLQRIFERVSGQNLQWFFDQWVYKTGVPMLKADYSFDKQTQMLRVNLTQTQPSNPGVPAVFRVKVDVKITTSTGIQNEIVEMNKQNQSFFLKVNGELQSVKIDKDTNPLMTIEVLREK